MASSDIAPSVPPSPMQYPYTMRRHYACGHPAEVIQVSYAPWGRLQYGVIRNPERQLSKEQYHKLPKFSLERCRKCAVEQDTKSNLQWVVNQAQKPKAEKEKQKQVGQWEDGFLDAEWRWRNEGNLLQGHEPHGRIAPSSIDDEPIEAPNGEFYQRAVRYNMKQTEIEAWKSDEERKALMQKQRYRKSLPFQQKKDEQCSARKELDKSRNRQSMLFMRVGENYRSEVQNPVPEPYVFRRKVTEFDVPDPWLNNLGRHEAVVAYTQGRDTNKLQLWDYGVARSTTFTHTRVGSLNAFAKNANGITRSSTMPHRRGRIEITVRPEDNPYGYSRPDPNGPALPHVPIRLPVQQEEPDLSLSLRVRAPRTWCKGPGRRR
ncbi:hypothetical protein EJ04DRAFT_558314 [Polyplosphaeria fusca]|uniref:Uncharacterized protein n=1 Tax=Polyplosphaeria fusca TaxID=682080 RepID=A0A9P4RA47_9PLEO|nr:hypothetical protein EJ04DRAFT_558314 [Polyplosphaeria fusca]